MGIKELIAAMREGEGDDVMVGEVLSKESSPVVTPVPPVEEALTAPTDHIEPVVVEAPVSVTVVPTIEKPKRGRKIMYDVSGMAVGDYLVYDGKLSSARVLASLKGDKKAGIKFQASEVETQVRITRKS